MSRPQLSVVHSERKSNDNLNQERATTMSRPDPNMIVFSQLLLSLFHHIDREQHGFGLKTKVYLYDKLGYMFLPRIIREAFRDYLLSNRPLNLPGVIDSANMQEIIQLLYEKMCSLFGPVNADSYLNKAIADTERLPEAKFFNPRELL